MNSPFKIKTGVRIPELDGLRGLAILLVLFHHCIFDALPPKDGAVPRLVHLVFPLTWSGVDLFFVLSGFLIGGILMDQRHTENYFKTFYIRRVCRIFPLYFLWLALFGIFSGFFSHSFHRQWAVPLFDQQGTPSWLYVVFLQNFHIAKTGLFGSDWMAATWSLAVEEQFYLFIPFLIWLIPTRRLTQVLAALVLMAPVFRLFLYLYYPQFMTYVLLPSRTDSLLIGVLCACWVRQERSRCWLEKHQSELFLALIVLSAGVGYLTAQVNGLNFWSAARSFDMVSWGYSWIALFYACLLLIVVSAKKGIMADVMRFSPLRRIGIISYGVYLMHSVVGALMHGLILGRDGSITDFLDGMVVLASILMTLLLAALSWHFFEKPIIRWGHSFSYTRKTMPATKARIAV